MKNEAQIGDGMNFRALYHHFGFEGDSKRWLTLGGRDLLKWNKGRWSSHRNYLLSIKDAKNLSLIYSNLCLVKYYILA
jgi:hypothetical protein